MLKRILLHYFQLQIHYQSAVSVLRIPIEKVIVVIEIPIVNDSDSIGHPWQILLIFNCFTTRPDWMVGDEESRIEANYLCLKA
jgi:hypothetical protein